MEKHYEAIEPNSKPYQSAKPIIHLYNLSKLMDRGDLYGTILCVEVYEAIRILNEKGKKATNRVVREYILTKHEIKLIGNQKENFTRRITSFTNTLTDAGLLSRQRKNSHKFQTTYYEYRIATKDSAAQNAHRFTQN